MKQKLCSGLRILDAMLTKETLKSFISGHNAGHVYVDLFICMEVGQTSRLFATTMWVLVKAACGYCGVVSMFRIIYSARLQEKQKKRVYCYNQWFNPNEAWFLIILPRQSRGKLSRNQASAGLNH